MLRFCTEILRGGKIFRGIRAAAGKDRGEKNRKGQDAQGHLIQHETAVVADARRECRLRRFVRYAVGSAGLVALLLQGKLVQPHPLRLATPDGLSKSLPRPRHPTRPEERR